MSDLDRLRFNSKVAKSYAIKDLEEIDFNGVTYIDKSSFTNCTSLKEVYIPDSVTYVGEWVFSYCKNLKKISINKNTFVDKNAFNECPAEIIWRD